MTRTKVSVSGSMEHFVAYLDECFSSPRKEILHNIDPLFDPAGVPKYNGTFKTSTRAALRVGDWKIITGEPGNSCNVFYTTKGLDKHNF